MVTQKAISFKIDQDTLERLGSFIRRDSHAWFRNQELNRAVRFYLDFHEAREAYNQEGDPKKMSWFVTSNFSKKEKSLFDQ